MTEVPSTPAPDPADEPNSAGESDPAAGPERVLSRDDSGRILTGVCAGLGRFTGMDPVLFRVGFAVLVLASGTGILLYAAAYLLMRRPDGRPGYLEQWTGRLFDSETVLALMAAVFALGLIINLGSGGINKGTIVIGTLLAIVLLAAHARGVDLRTLVRSMPERAAGRHATQATAPAAGAPMTTPTAPFTAPPTAAAPTAPSTQPPYGPGFQRHGTAPQSPPGETGSTGVHAASSGTGTADSTETVHGVPPAPADAASAGRTTPAIDSGPPPGASAAPGYRRLADLAREARAGTLGYDYGAYGSAGGEPYAPHGPYAPPHHYPPEPYQPAAAPPVRGKTKPPGSFIGKLTIVLALIVGGIMATVQQSGTGSVSLPLIGGAVLVTIGAGLLVATWFGRGAALIAAGTVVALALIAGSTVSGIPEKAGNFVWRPVSVTQAATTYTVGVGNGRLDLSDLALKPGTRVRFDAAVSVGQFTVIVPPSARVEAHGYTRAGEVKIDHSVRQGTDVRLDQVMEPEVIGDSDAPTIELYVRAAIGDVEVRRAS